MQTNKDITSVGFQDSIYYKQVAEFGKRILFPTVEIVDKSPFASFAELKGTMQFIEYVNRMLEKQGLSKLKLNDTNDIWKFATFISYIGDERDISILNTKTSLGSAPVMVGNALNPLNITQSANFTLAAFSGDCNDWARLYAAVITMLCPQKNLDKLEVYSVYFTPFNSSKAGHVTNLYTIDGIRWHSMDFQNEVIWTGSPWKVGYVWSVLHQQGWSGYAITITKNIFINPSSTINKNVQSYTPPVASADIDYLINKSYINPKIKQTVINHIYDNDWQPFQNVANNIFTIEGTIPSSTEGGGADSLKKLEKYAPLVVGGLIIGLIMNRK